MPGVNCRFSSSSSSSFSSSSSSQISTPRTLENGCLQNLLCVSPRLSSSHMNQIEKKYSEKANTEIHTSSSSSRDVLTPKSSAELENEIRTLDFEILRLERYLLTMYRTAFEEQVPSISNVPRRSLNLRSDLQKQRGGFVYRSSSCLEASSLMEMKRTESGTRRLADLLGVSHMLQNLETPNKLSQDLITHISAVYHKLSAFRSTNSTASFFSSSPSVCSDGISVNRRSETTVESSGSELAVVDVHKLRLDEDNFKYIETMLRSYKLLVQNLEKVDPIKMTREEKLAFWINVHNALLMHAYLAYGTCDRAKSTSVLKAAYNVGGRSVNAYDIQSSILSIRPHYQSPRRQTLFSPSRKPKTGCDKHVYVLEYTEPLVHFGLCSGTSAEPLVRVYTPESVFQDLREARDEFVRANVVIENETKIHLPRILYYYAKDASLDTAGLMEAIMRSLSETQRKAVRKCLKGRQGKCVHWLPKVSGFRYVIHGDLVRGRTEV